MNLQLSSFQLNHLLNEQCLLHNASANHKNNEIKVNYFFSDYDDEIVTDKIKLNQVINNLINNAIKFTSNGQIEIGYKVTDNLLMFWIKDSGIGIAPEHLKVIFERFRQVETEFNRMYGGTGLGLSISKAYVEFMGGNIWVESELDKGSNFYFTIPLIQNNIDNKTSIQSSAKNYPNLTGNIILIAEDEDMNYYFLRELLEVCNATILRAENGREAIEICKNQKVDLVLMDIKMPDLNGLEASSIIKTSIKPDIHIIAQTAYAYDEDKDKAKINFCDGYITKPINKTELYELLNKFLVTGMPKI
jgi:CheY-like chemotaxis protein